MTIAKKMNTGGWGYVKVMTILFPYSCSKTEKDLSLYQNKKHHRYEAYQRTLTNHRLYPCHSRTPDADKLLFIFTE